MMITLQRSEKLRLARLAGATGLALSLLLVAGCSHQEEMAEIPYQASAPQVRPAYSYPATQQVQSAFPSAQPVQRAFDAPQPAYRNSDYPSTQPYRNSQPQVNQPYQFSRIPANPLPPGGITQADIEYVNSHRPIQTEEGYATWYTSPYKGRRAANGDVFSDAGMTAAHRTLPIGTLVVVTNLKTGESSAMRINDRGPFVDGRILDLSIASAKATGVYREGLALVRMDVYEAPKSMTAGGRWCVQIGGFTSEHMATRLKESLLERYPGSQVIEFPGDQAYWVRIRPQGESREMAEHIAQHLHITEGDAFITRLD